MPSRGRGGAVHVDEELVVEEADVVVSMIWAATCGSVRRPDTPAAGNNEEALVVTFAEAVKTARWRPGDGSLLDLAEAVGAPALSGCQAGLCGTCAILVLAGRVDYAEPPVHGVESEIALICVVRPNVGPHPDGSDDREGVTLAL